MSLISLIPARLSVRCLQGLVISVSRAAFVDLVVDGGVVCSSDDGVTGKSYLTLPSFAAFSYSVPEDVSRMFPTP